MGRVEVRALDKVGEQVHPELEIGREEAGVEGRQLAVGGGIEVPADVLDQLADLPRRAAPGTLEDHMFEKVCDSVQAFRFVARAGRRIKSDRDRLDALHRPARDAEAIRQGRELHHFKPSLDLSRWRSAMP